MADIERLKQVQVQRWSETEVVGGEEQFLRRSNIEAGRMEPVKSV
jgi:hypothetical protein